MVKARKFRLGKESSKTYCPYFSKKLKEKILEVLQEEKDLRK